MALEVFAEGLKLIVLIGLALAGVLTIQIWKKDLSSKITYLRLFVQLVSLISIFYIYALIYVYSAAQYYFVMVAVLFLMTIVLGRLFCGWMCPFGFYMDLISLVRKAFRIRYRLLSDKLNITLNRFRYVILAIFVFSPVALIFLLNAQGPWQFMLILYGPYRPLMVLLSPLEPLIIPWHTGIVFNGINISFPYVSDIIFYLSNNPFYQTSNFIFEVIGFFVLMIIGSFFVRRFWCRFCPTGATFSILNRFSGFKWMPVLHIDKSEEKCTKCGICQRVCPAQVKDVYEQKGGKIMTSVCLQCYRCVEMCPYKDALQVKAGGKVVFGSRNWLEEANKKKTEF
jgi:ferredoxin-type protein NapH